MSPSTETYTRNYVNLENRSSPLRVHFSFQANMATFLLCAIQNFQRGRARARAEGSVSSSTDTDTRNYFNLEIRSVAVKGSL